MYELKQAGNIACDNLKQHLKPHGYSTVKYAPGFWTHLNSELTFTSIADDFRIRHTNVAQVRHLIMALKKKCTITVDGIDTLHTGVALHWDHNERMVNLSIPCYVRKVPIK